MNREFLYIPLFLLGLLSATAAPAEDGDWHVTGSFVYNDDDPDRAIADSLSGMQVTVGKDLTSYLTMEGLLGYADGEGYVDPGESYPDQTQLDLSANLLAFYDRDASFAPYFLIGLGYLGVELEPGGSDNGPSVSLGGGFRQRFGDSPWSLRVEIRTRTVFDGQIALGGTGTLTDVLGSIGVQYSFGKGTGRSVYEASEINTDTDGDGVLDMWDECPDTPAGVDVTARGCEIVDMTRDTDGDRVPDYRDECPDTTAGAPVDPRGCSLDSDMDGVLTGQDRCPGTSAGARVDEYGCAINTDIDGDGVLNEDDRCPNTRPGARIDVYGCEIRDIITLPGVNFATGSDQLLGGTETLLRDAARTLNRYPELRVEVAGHTDNVGSADLNLGLSDRRAKTVLDHLVMFGVDPSRLTFRGYGELEPIMDNATAEGRAANRRVELRIISSD